MQTTDTILPGFRYTTSEAAEIFGKSRREIVRMCDAGELWTWRRNYPGEWRRIALDKVGTERLLERGRADFAAREEARGQLSISTPTTRRMTMEYDSATDAVDFGYGHEKRIALFLDPCGDNVVGLALTEEEYRVMMTPEAIGAVCSPSPARLGSWQRFAEEVARVRVVVAFIGWTLTPDEAALLATLEGYSRQAPARYVTAA